MSKNRKSIKRGKRKRKNENVNKKNIRENLTVLCTLIVALTGVIAVILTYCSGKREEMQNKPTLDFDIQYIDENCFDDMLLDSRGNYIDKIVVRMLDGKNVNSIDIEIESFYNIIYYNYHLHSLIKQYIPILNFSKTEKTYAPFDLKMKGKKDGEILEIIKNNETYLAYCKILEMFNVEKYTNLMDEITNRVDESIITSIDIEYYVTVNYTDIYNNHYEEVYLCETGMRGFSGFTNCFQENIDNDGFYSDLEKTVEYAALKTHKLSNGEFDANFTKISSEDIVYSTFHDYYKNIRYNTGSILFPIGLDDYIDINLKDIIMYGYEKEQMIFIIDENMDGWRVYKPIS